MQMRTRMGGSPNLTRWATAGAVITLAVGVAATAIVFTPLFNYSTMAITTGVWLTALLVFTLLDSVRTLGFSRAILFTALVGGLSLAAEYLGSRYGVFFGRYVYHPERAGFMVLNQVPAVTLASWWVIIYLSFATTSQLPELLAPKEGRGKGLWMLLAVLDGFAAMAVDLSIEPVFSEYRGVWEWLDAEAAAYAGAPLSNYASWFLLAFLVSLVFREFLSRSPLVSMRYGEKASARLLEGARPMLYLLFALRLVAIIVTRMGRLDYAFIGLAAVLPLPSLVLLLSWRARRGV